MTVQPAITHTEAIRRPILSALCCSVVFAVLGVPRLAWGAPPTRPDASAEFEPRWILKANPLGLLIGRFGADLELVPAAHWGITLAPHYWVAGNDSGGSSECVFCVTSFRALGAEASVRAYLTSDVDASGFWLGATGVVDRVRVLGDSERTVFVSSAFVDLGWQKVFAEPGQPGFVLGAGGGFLVARYRDGADSDTLVEAAVRGLFQLGYGW